MLRRRALRGAFDGRSRDGRDGFTTSDPSPRGRLVAVALPATILGLAAVALPLSLPILEIDRTERYIRAITFGAFQNVYELTADLRGMFGWREQVAAVAEVYHSLPADERAGVIIASWYGPAGAIDHFGPELGLPPAVSTHLGYHLWGLPESVHGIASGAEPGTLVVVDHSQADLEQIFERVELVKVVQLADVNPWDREYTIHLCREPKLDLVAAWPELGRHGFD